MNAPLFVLRDRRQSGEVREIRRFVDPAEAASARDLLVAAGDHEAVVEIIGADEIVARTAA